MPAGVTAMGVTATLKARIRVSVELVSLGGSLRNLKTTLGWLIWKLLGFFNHSGAFEMSTFGIYEKTTCTTEIECWIFMTVTWYLGGVFVEIPIGWYDFIEFFSSTRLLWRNVWQCDVTSFSVCPFFLALIMVHPEVLDILRARKWWCSKKNLFPPSIFRMACFFSFVSYVFIEGKWLFML